jgi:hypothetical protein
VPDKPPSKRYLEALAKANRASAEFKKAQEAYRSRQIGDKEFLKARAKWDESDKEFDAAYAAEQSGGRESNPSQQAQVNAAAERFTAFTGHSASELQRVHVPDKKVFLVVGELLAVAYGTVRAGQYDEWHHEFRKRSRPLLAVSHDGRSLSIVGGRFEFTDAGIEDR